MVVKITSESSSDHTNGHKCNFKPYLPHISLYVRITNYQIAFQGCTVVKNLPTNAEMHETQFWSLGREDPLEEEMATRSRILAWKIPWMEEPGGLQSTGHKESEVTEWLSMRNYQIHLNIRDVHMRKVGW